MSKKSILLVVAVALLAAACGSSDTGSTTTTTTTAAPETTTTTIAPPETTTTTAAPVAITFTGADEVVSTITDTSRIVSLNGDLTEILFDLGLGDQVVGIDFTTTYPPEANAIPRIGLARQGQLSAEAVLAVEPTLVIGDTQVGPAEAVEQIRAAGVPVAIIETASDFEGVARKIEDVAAIVGETEAGATLAAQVSDAIDDAVTFAGGAADTPKVAFVYVQGPQVLLLFGRGMATQALIEGANAVDAGTASGILGAVPLTPEALVAAAPDVIILPTTGLEALGGVAAFAQIPGVAETPAGASDRFLSYEEGFFLGFGPRTGDVIRQLAVDLHPDLAG